jgi:hypothetical protein
MRPKWLLMIPIGIAAMTFFVFIGGTITQLLWNWLLPPIFGWKELSFWQALGMLTLCRILFGGISSRGGYGGRRHNWSPEDKARFRQWVGGRWRPAAGSPPDAPAAP